MTDMQAKFQEKLRKETGVEDIVIDWSSYHRTPPAYLRNYDPAVCSAFADMSSDTINCKSILFYNSLRDLCRKNVHLHVYQDGKIGIDLKVSASAESKICCYCKDGSGVPAYNYKF